MTTNCRNARPQVIVTHFDVPVNLAGVRLTRAGRTVEGECDGMRSCRGCRPLGILPRGPRTKQATLGAGDAHRQGNDGPVSRRAFQEDDTLVATYHYDGLFRRTHSTVDGADRHFYFDRAWRVLEERPGSETATPDRLYTWGVRHRTDMVCRDAELPGIGSAGSSAGSSSSSLSTQRHYVAYDWISPTLILAAANGAPVERYGYSAFGQRKVMDAGYSERGATEYEWCFAFHGQFEDVETRWMNYGFRYYSGNGGRWLSRDALEEAEGPNLYTFLGNSSTINFDLLGLKKGLFLSHVPPVKSESDCPRTVIVLIGGALDKMTGAARNHVPHDVYATHERGDDVKRFLRALRACCPRTKVALIGHSWGGKSAVNVARALESESVRIDRMITLDAVGRGGDAGRYHNKPTNVGHWTNIYNDEIHRDYYPWSRFNQVIARAGGHWQSRRGAEINTQVGNDHVDAKEMLGNDLEYRIDPKTGALNQYPRESEGMRLWKEGYLDSALDGIRWIGSYLSTDPEGAFKCCRKISKSPGEP